MATTAAVAGAVPDTTITGMQKEKSGGESGSAVIRFLQLKRYQYEVTFSLYMLTPIEKVIFNTFLFIALSLLIIAVSFYLPHHIAIIANRAWYYYAGEDAFLVRKAATTSILKEL